MRYCGIGFNAHSKYVGNRVQLKQYMILFDDINFIEGQTTLYAESKSDAKRRFTEAYPQHSFKAVFCEDDVQTVHRLRD